MVKHVRNLSKSIPAKAFALDEGQSNVMNCIKGFFQDPMGAVQQLLQKGA